MADYKELIDAVNVLASDMIMADLTNVSELDQVLKKIADLRNIPQIAAMLVAHGRSPDTPVAIISRGTTRRQAEVAGTLATIASQLAEARLSPPAVTVIGEVVKMREKLPRLRHQME